MSSKIVWTGRILTWLVGVFMLTSGLNAIFVHSAEMMEAFAKFGYAPGAMAPIGVSALVGSVLYLIPLTEVLGAIILTGYLGGAVATHVRIGDPTFVVAIVVGILLWLGLFLKDEKLRALLPWRK